MVQAVRALAPGEISVMVSSGAAKTSSSACIAARLYTRSPMGWRRGEGRRGHPGAGGDREDPQALGAGADATVQEPGAQDGAAPRGLSSTCLQTYGASGHKGALGAASLGSAGLRIPH